MDSLKKPVVLLFTLLSFALCAYVHFTVEPTWKEQLYSFATQENEAGALFYEEDGVKKRIESLTPYANSPLTQAALNLYSKPVDLDQQWVTKDGSIYLSKPSFHLGFWSIFPAFLAIFLCLVTKEPLIALMSGIISGALLLGKFDLIDAIIIPSLATESAAGILLLYLWLLGGLMGVWSKTGAAQAFADHMTEHYVSGPRSAKLVAWFLGVIFFQGGTVSTVLVGTTVKPLADKANVSHEEMAYIVDSTASPIASVIAFNAWPAYVQALIFVPGVAFLATAQDRINFFFSSIPFSFYGIIAVLGTLLLSLNIMTFSGKRLRQARLRAIKTGQLDAPTARPMSAEELSKPSVPAGYKSSMLEFILPLLLLIGIAITTFLTLGSPKVAWAFAAALLLSVLIALAKNMSIHDLIDGFNQGVKGVVLGSVILMLAVIIGLLSRQVGGGLYLIDFLGEGMPYWCLPIFLQVLTMVIAFSTGTSWGTYAIAFPLAMPLAWSIAMSSGIDNPEIYMMICFATVLNGSVCGDQCSPISDTTILSSMTTGCDLMDHVKSQIYPASLAAVLAAILWTLSALIFA